MNREDAKARARALKLEDFSDAELLAAPRSRLRVAAIIPW